MSGQPRAINCANCGAGLPVLGGGRVASQVCGYCGSVLDANEDYRLLARYLDMPRPDTPFQLGQEGMIRGITFQVIGILGMVERHRGKVWRWTEHQLFSPTHGYAWLTWEDGHLVFSRKLRAVPGRRFWTADRIEKAEHRPRFSWGGETFRYYETSTARIEFAEGAFNWVPRFGDGTISVSFLGQRRMISFVSGGAELEVEVTELLPLEETLAAFCAERRPPPKKQHCLKPYDAWPEERFLKWTAAAAAIIFLVASVSGGGTQVSNTVVSLSSLPREIPFDITVPDRLAEIRLRSNVRNSWLWTGLTVEGPDEAPLFQAVRDMEYYFGRSGGESWSEGSSSAGLTFMPTKAGRHTLIIDEAESGTWGSGRRPTQLAVSVFEDVFAGGWLILAAAISGLTALLPVLRRLRHRSRQFSGSDWSEES